MTSCGRCFVTAASFSAPSCWPPAKENWTKPDVDRLLIRQGLDGTDRAERLDPDAMLALCEAVQSELSAR